MIFEHGSGAVKYCVVDTGGWLSSHKFLVDLRRHIVITICLAAVEENFQSARLWVIADGLDHARFDWDELCHGVLHLH